MLAGGFLLAGVVLAVVVSFVLSGATERLQSRREYIVLFDVAQGATGLKPGSDVRLGGQGIGKVTRVAVDPDGSGLVKDIAVHVSVRADIKLYANAAVFLDSPLLGSLSTINIAAAGGPTSQSASPLEEGQSLRAKIAPPAFLAQAGYGDEQAEQVRKTIAAAEKAATRLEEVIDKAAPKVERAIDDATTIVSDARKSWDGWRQRIDNTTASIESASAKIGPILDEAGAGAKEARGAIADGRRIINEAEPKVAATLDSTKSFAEKLDKATIEKIDGAIRETESALAAFRDSLGEGASLLREQAPNIRRTLANARLASDQLKLATIEIRSQPWRLLYTPSLKEVESSVLYDSTRAYAAAASDLRATAESLEATMGSISGSPGAAHAAERATVLELIDKLKRDFESYRDVEEGLFSKLVGGGAASAIPPAGSTRGGDVK